MNIDLSIVTVSLIAIFLFILIEAGSVAIDKKIEQAKGSSGKKLRTGIRLALLRFHSQDLCRLSVFFKVPTNEVKKQLDILNKPRLCQKT